MKYKTIREIVIPIGTEIAPAPIRSERRGPHGEILIEFSKNATGNLCFDISEAISAGLIAEEEWLTVEVG